MFLELKEIRDAPQAFSRTVSLSDVEGAPGQPLVVGPVCIAGEAIRGPGGVRLTASVEASVRLECCRCLEPSTSNVAADFTLRVVPEATDDPDTPSETEVSATDAEVYHAGGPRLDLAAVAREQVLLALPLKPVCAPECAGLCQTCGANRNRIECGCSASQPDLRLAPLLELKKRLGGS